jgi:hypothetical protein
VTNSKQVLRDDFSKALKDGLLIRYRELPSAAFEAYGCPQDPVISQRLHGTAVSSFQTLCNEAEVLLTYNALY